MELEIKVASGDHDRRLCPVELELGTEVAGELDTDALQLLNDEEAPVSLQCFSTEAGGLKLSWILDQLPKNSSACYRLVEGSGAPPEQGGVELEEKEGEIKVSIGGDYFTSYNYSYAKPCLAPVIGPYGEEITRFEPENPEHPHQRSIFFAHGDINGIDGWNEPEGKHAKVSMDEFLKVEGGPVFAEIASRNTWTDFDGKPLIADRRSTRIYNLPEQGRLIDRSLTFIAEHGEVELGPTKEAGPLGVRVAPSMTVDNGGRIENAYGAVNEAETWSKRAPWCDYSGQVGGNTVGIAVFDHPENEHHPTHWHVRNYGLLAPNNFYFSGGSRRLEAEESVTYNYRIYLHSGDTDAARVSERYHDYINPPQVEVID